jgi:hypothetical protein
MSVMMSSPTADPFGISSTFPEKVHRVAPSTVNLTLLDGTIQAVLSSWEQMHDAPLGRWANVPAVHVIGRPYPETPEEAVDYVRDVLQITRDAVYPAVGVRERTFHNWQKKPDTRPRARSLGKLWPMIDALFHLQAAHPNIAAWYHSTPAAQDAFNAGDVNRLLQLELEYVNMHAVSLTTSRVPAPYFGDPGDLVEEIVEEATDATAPMKAPKIRTTPRRRVKQPLTVVATKVDQADEDR